MCEFRSMLPTIYNFQSIFVLKINATIRCKALVEKTLFYHLSIFIFYFYFSLFLCVTVSVEVYNWLILPGIIRVQLLAKIIQKF